MDLSTLNPQQREAVRHGDGPLLLLAGAGSGKTRVITVRIAWLLRQRRVPAEQLLAMTFTNKAAREMKERVLDLVGGKAAEGMVISTFHSLGMRLLREEIERLGYKRNFSIYGSADQLRLVRDLLRGAEGEQRPDAERVLWHISDAKNRLDVLSAATAGHDRERQAAARLLPDYQRALQAFNAVDFDDILLLTVRLLRDYPEVLERWQQRFRYVMVDEYQDTNRAQYELLRLLCARHRNLCVVGDDDQSIYGWRGAEPENILEFERDYPGAQVIKLEQNYRSTGTILAAANAVIAGNQQRRGKRLWSAGAPGEPIELVACAGEEDEAQAVVERLQARRFRDRLAYRDFAILYRTNVQSRVFEEQLRYENIPYVLIGGQQFFDRKEVKDALAYLQVLVNPFDEVNLLRILNYPRRGIGETSAQRLIETSARLRQPLWEVLRRPHGLEDLGERPLAALAQFAELLERYRGRFRRPAALAEVARQLFAEVGFEEEILRGADDPAKARRRLEHVAEVVNALAAYQEREAAPTLAGFLDKVSLLDRDDPGRGDKDDKLAQDAVVLMSLHSSKGLEFPHVYLVGLEEGYLPFESERSQADVDEERRLLYVGITRARQSLTVLHAASRRKFGKTVPRVPSRFLQEFPGELVQRSVAAVPPAAPAEVREEMASSFFSGMRSLLGD